MLLLLKIWRTGEDDGEGSPQALRGWMGEVENRTGADHRMVGIGPGLGSSQKGCVHRLDLRKHEPL